MDRLTRRNEFGISRVCHYPDREGNDLIKFSKMGALSSSARLALPRNLKKSSI